MVPQLSVAISGLQDSGPERSSIDMPTAPPVVGWMTQSHLRADRVDDLGEALGRLGVRPVVVAHVQVDDRGSRLAAARRLVRHLAAA